MGQPSPPLRGERVAAIRELTSALKAGALSRRDFLRQAIALGAGATLASYLLATAPRAAAAPAADPARGRSRQSKELRVLGVAVSLQEPFNKKFEEETGYTIIPTAGTLSGNMSKMLTGGADQFDVLDQNASYMPPTWDAGVLQPIPAEKVPNLASLLPLFTDPKAVGVVDGWPVSQVWVDDSHQELKGVPHFWNFEGFGFVKEAAPDLDARASYGAIVAERFRGRAALWNDPLWTPSWVGLYLQKNNLAPIQSIATDMTQPEIDTVMDKLKEWKKAGQFRALWDDYGGLVNLMTAKEVVIADAWNPIINDVTKNGTPAQYVNPREGSRPWFHFLGITRGARNLEAAYAYVNWAISGWKGAQIASLGWYDATTNVKKFLDPKEYEFWYAGGGRDTGSMEERITNIAFWPRWPREMDYQLSRWLNFLAS